MNSFATAWPCSFEMTLRENELVNKRHFEEVGEAYASDPRLRNLIVMERL